MVQSNLLTSLRAWKALDKEEKERKTNMKRLCEGALEGKHSDEGSINLELTDQSGKNNFTSCRGGKYCLIYKCGGVHQGDAQ
eukprot:scaffold103406_cov15-Tisochrysis_lutea.AAC.1